MQKQNGLKHLFFFITLLGCICPLSAQVKTTTDTTAIRLGEQITLSLEIESDTTTVVVFPEGQAFTPLEVIESYPTDTTLNEAKYRLVKKYGLTQFDSGTFTIPRQPIAIGDNTVFSDSIRVEVFNVLVDSTKQGLYDIKPLIEIQKPASNWWLYLLIGLLIIGLIAFLMYWFIWRKKPLTEEEKIALLSPYERVKLALKQLEEREHSSNLNIKGYYSELTLAFRTYIDEKVYDKALESTTDELIGRLNLLSDGNQIRLSKSTIENIESILKRADLVKFAKSEPNIELAKLDRQTISKEVESVTAALPEPDEEEKLANETYRLAQERKEKRKKIITTTVVAVGLLLLTYVGFGFKYGFNYVFDTLTANHSLQLLEGDWVESAYGAPPIYIATPEVLKRVQDSLNAVDVSKTTVFTYGDLDEVLSVSIKTQLQNSANETQSNQDNATQTDINTVSEAALKSFEKLGATDIILKREQFVTPNGAEGLKTYGTLVFNGKNENYAIFHFVAPEVIQELILTWEVNNTYTEQISERIINSIELTKKKN